MTYNVRKDRQLIVENEHMISAGRREASTHLPYAPHAAVSNMSVIGRGPVRPRGKESPAVRAEVMRKLERTLSIFEKVFHNPISVAVALVALCVNVVGFTLKMTTYKPKPESKDPNAPAEFLAADKDAMAANDSMYDAFQRTINSLSLEGVLLYPLTAVLWGAVVTLGARWLVNYLYKTADDAVEAAEKAASTAEELEQVRQLQRQMHVLSSDMRKVS